MRLLLAQAPFRDTFGYSMPPPGLLRLAGELERLGLPVELEDLAFRAARGELANGLLMCESAARLLLRKGDYDVIGLSVMGATLPAALEITRRLRELAPDTRLLLGGPGLTGADELVLERFPWIDAVLRGEAERTLPEVLARLERGMNLSGVLGTSWRDEEGNIHREADRPQIANLAELAPYAWGLLPGLDEYKQITGEREGLTPLDSGRGCVFDCSFCTIGQYWGRRSRPLPAALLVDEVHALGDLPGARNAYLCHDLFAADRAHAEAFCRGMIARGARPWECRARVDHLDGPLLELMAAAGCYRVLLGIESAAPSVRELANKGQYAQLDVLDVVRHCARVGIRPILSLILGLPGEGPEELEASLALVARAALLTDSLISLHLVNPQIGCGLHASHGAESRPVDGIPPDMAVGCGETSPERALIAAHPDLFSTWSLLPGEEQQWKHLASLAQLLPPILTRYPRTWELLRLARKTSHHGLFREWRATQLEFVRFARRHAQAFVDDALNWECAIAELDGALDRDAARADEEFAPADEDWVRSRARVIPMEHDLLEMLDTPGALPSRFPTWIAVSPIPGGVASDRISAPFGQLLQELEAPQQFGRLASNMPGVHLALQALARAGLVEISGAPNADSSEATTS